MSTATLPQKPTRSPRNPGLPVTYTVANIQELLGGRATVETIADAIEWLGIEPYANFGGTVYFAGDSTEVTRFFRRPAGDAEWFQFLEWHRAKRTEEEREKIRKQHIAENLPPPIFAEASADVLKTMGPSTLEKSEDKKRARHIVDPKEITTLCLNHANPKLVDKHEGW